ncbi:Microsomal signal peptidase 12kDa subunit [Corchorus olitorius]|uniref:Microsomal signal peptidase 12kDa subunit n=1 Tax=Corchorus olitorius TaxID=93759 RepID=A0A1R3JHJ6_9ROSI|nr:Microsomal signal peptidase 12kDa subunit [Corchorus olitorius]
MGKDAALRSAIVWLAGILVLVGICTLSLKKMMITYAFGMLGIAGILLPDWDFFDRDFSRWCYPITAEERAALLARRSGFFKRYRLYPMRVIIYTTIYGFGLYKWWNFVSS